MSSHAFMTPRLSALGLSAVAGGMVLALHPSGAEAAERAPLAAAPATHVVPAQPSPPPSGHTVVAGESVSTIAARYGLATTDVLAWNGLSFGDSVIRPGDVLVLAAPAAAPPAAAPAAPAPAAPAAPAPLGHLVQAGDTIAAIAARNGTTTQAVLAANGLTWDSIIYPGQTIAVPAASAPAPAPAAAPAADSAPAPAPAPAPIDLDAEQIANARIIIGVGRELGVPDRGIVIALGTAMQESWIRNLDWGDRDSLGLFQQRPSTGWGTEEEIRDATRAARAFYGGAQDPNGSRTRGLLDIPGWESLPYADAAQAVQISAYPDRYARWEQPATTWLAALG
ncbi:LysM peptidoglycan-binding domain-containing protein [Microbacterium caowuchunii]|nr:LysM domain-containing protein [Microbacterium caowuchunii]QEW00299.1 LysM peptidoglycan-binding domain-containing protein [Microbacterium caowuchunii]